jgi:hypothetical protein
MPTFQPQSADKRQESDVETIYGWVDSRINPPTISSDPLIAAIAVPMLLGLVGSRAIAHGLQRLGQASEEMFRGDRLPVLQFPLVTDSDPEQS